MNGYYYQTRNGKKVRVKKNFRRRIKSDTISGTAAAVTSGGFIIGSGLVSGLAKTATTNKILRNTAYAGGAIGGSVVATVIAIEPLRPTLRVWTQNLTADCSTIPPLKQS